MHDKGTNVCNWGNAVICIAPNLLNSYSKNKEGGYSLIELIVTIILIGIAFPGLLGFITNSMIDTVKNEVINEAVLLAGEKMEQICADKNEPTKGIPYITTPNQYPPEAIEKFTRNVTVQNIMINNIPIIEVIVTISHPIIAADYTLTHLFTEYNGN